MELTRRHESAEICSQGVLQARDGVPRAPRGGRARRGGRHGPFLAAHHDRPLVFRWRLIHHSACLIEIRGLIGRREFPEILKEIRVRKYTHNRREILVWAKGLTCGLDTFARTWHTTVALQHHGAGAGSAPHVAGSGSSFASLLFLKAIAQYNCNAQKIRVRSTTYISVAASTAATAVSFALPPPPPSPAC